MEWLRQWQAELPKFQTPMDLRKNSGWKRYLGHVYGQDTLSFPIDLRMFSFFYQEILPSNDKRMTQYPQSCRRPGDVYTLNGGLCYNSSIGTAVWVYRWDHPAVALHEFPATPELSYGLMSAVEPHKKVEVYHCRDNIGQSAPYFMYRADGSGIYYDVGKTKVFHDQHKTGWTYTETYNFYSFWREKGFDSVQYPNYLENGLYKFEIVDLRSIEYRSIQEGAKVIQPRNNACPTGALARAAFTKGWGGVRPCKCNEGWDTLNCNGIYMRNEYYKAPPCDKRLVDLIREHNKILVNKTRPPCHWK